jgi:putative phosphoribosyl transferase
MAKIIADDLQGELDVVLVHKLGAPGQPEFAIGAVDEKGRVYLTDVAAELEISAQYLAREKEEQLGTLRRRRAQ